MNYDYDQIMERLGLFLLSDSWKIVKYRLLFEFCETLQKETNTHVKNQDVGKAAYTLGRIDGVREAIEITERLGSELKKGKLDVDAALSVIEKKNRRR